MNELEGEDDGGFVGYVPRTVDLGTPLLAASVLSFLIAYGLLLPLLLAWGKRREEQRKSVDQTLPLEEEEGGADEQQVVAEAVVAEAEENHPEDTTEDDRNSNTSSASSTNSSTIYAALERLFDLERLCNLEGLFDQRRTPRTKKKRRERRKHEKLMQQSAELDDNFYAAADSNAEANVSGESLASGVSPDGMPPATEDPVFAPHPATSTSPEEQKDKYPTALEVKTVEEQDDFSSWSALDKIAAIAAWDIEMKRIVRLSMPYCTQALITGLLDILTVAVIGTQIGTREVSAFVIVNLLVELSSEFVGGLHEALATLCSQAIGAKNKKLAGQYVQIVMLLYSICFAPFMIIWGIYMEDAIRWLGFDEETVQMGKQYTYIIIFDLLLDGLCEAIHGLLDVAGLEKFSTLIGGAEEIGAFLIILFVALFGNPDLITVGLIQFGMGVLFLVLNISIIMYKGWHLPYKQGLYGSFAMTNTKAVWLVCKTAGSLSFGMLLINGEWEILTVFASYLGPAEVVAWGIYGTVADGCHELLDGIADACEVRCAYLLGAGMPDRAKLCAYKALLVGGTTGLLLVSLIYIAGDDLPTWLTSDPALQHLLEDLLPLFGFSNLVLSITTMSWTLLGSQGRYRLSTAIACICSCFITLPLSALLSVHFKINLQGQTTAYVLGYLVAGLVQTYFLLRSDWDNLSRIIMEHQSAELLRDAPSSFIAPVETHSNLT